MMNTKITRLLTACFCALSTSALAGTPIDTEVACPIGGEKFTIKETASCSATGTRYMNFKAASSCEFVTALQQCPTNKLPVYKEFSDDEKEKISAFMETPEYQSAADVSRYYLAYVIDEYLEDESINGTTILIDGYWNDFDNVIDNADYWDATLAGVEADDEIIPDENRPYINAMLAYYGAMSDHADVAKERLEMVKSDEQALSNDEQLVTYVEKIESCIGDATLEICDPEAVIVDEAKLP